MSSRHLIAYALMAGLAAAGLAALWFGVLRERWALRRRRRRVRRDRRRAAANPSVGVRPVFETD